MKLFVCKKLYVYVILFIDFEFMFTKYFFDHVSYKKQEDKCLWIIREYLGTMQF